VVAGACLGVTDAAGQGDGGFVIVSPEEGDVIESPVTVVVETDGVPAGTRVPFRVIIDGQIPSTPSKAHTMMAGSQAAVDFGAVRPGVHRVQVQSVDGALAPATVAFSVQKSEGGFNPAFPIIAVLLIGFFILYRTKILRPVADRLSGAQDEEPPSGRSEGWGEDGGDRTG
jgi:hypothetical protein